MDTCEECGFTYDERDALEAAATTKRLALDICDLLTVTDWGELLQRPAADTWSPLEYGCHVRDVLQVQRDRILWARRTDDPEPAPMGRDERVDHDGYAEQDPLDVARQLVDAALLYANVLDRLGPDDWDRGMVYGYPPPPIRRSLRWVAVHTVHELVHHLGDMTATELRG